MFILTATLCDTVINVAPCGEETSRLTVACTMTGHTVAVAANTQMILDAAAYALAGADSEGHPQHFAAYRVQRLLDAAATADLHTMWGMHPPKDAQTQEEEYCRNFRIVP